MAGRFRKGKRIRLFKKAKKAKTFKGTQIKLSNIMAKGAIVNKEVGISTNGVTDAVYLGHATFCRQQYIDCLFRVLVKRSFIKMGVPIANWGDYAAMDLNDVIHLYFKPDQDAATAVSAYSYINTGIVTYEQIVQSFVTWFYTLTDHDITFVEMVYFGTDHKKRGYIRLENASIDIYCKSALKLQNTTVSAAGGEADDVDNVPVNGKSYYGRGNGTTNNRGQHTEATFYALEDAGVIQKLGTNASGLSEMPPIGYFRNVSRVGKVKVDPGHIKYSTLLDQYTVSVNWLVRKLVGVQHAKDVSDVGKFRFFGFEHVIKASADAPLIKIFGEINLQVGMMIKEKFNTNTDQKVFHGYVTY